MGLNLILTRIGTVLLNLIWVKEELLRDGMKDSPPWKKVKELRSSVLHNMPMEREAHPQESHQIPPCTSKSNFWISNINKRKNGNWANNKNWPKPQKPKIKEIRPSKKVSTNKPQNFTTRVLASLKMKKERNVFKC